jgi:urease accessory protein
MNLVELEQAHLEARLWQLFDSALPNGGYAHSQGLEGLVQAGEIVDEATLCDFLHNEFADNLIFLELPLCRLAHESVVKEELPSLTILDDLSWAVRPSRELRQAASACGRQTVLLFERILSVDTSTGRSLQRIAEHFSRYQTPVVIGAIAGVLELSPLRTQAAMATQMLHAAIAPMIKLLQFGPSQVQRLLFDSAQAIPDWMRRSADLAQDQLGCFAPRWDLASAHHEFAERRLFIS